MASGRHRLLTTAPDGRRVVVDVWSRDGYRAPSPARPWQTRLPDDEPWDVVVALCRGAGDERATEVAG
jgi:hypothetical protein